VKQRDARRVLFASKSNYANTSGMRKVLGNVEYVRSPAVSRVEFRRGSLSHKYNNL
jgi:hypothetical protein